MEQVPGRDIEKLTELLQRGDRIADAAAIAGTAIAAPLVAVRRRQAAIEAARTERRLGPDHRETRERQAQARLLALRGAEWQQDLARQTLQRPEPSEGAGLYGRVTRDSVPLAGLVVSALGEDGDMLARTCTGREGDYALAFQGGELVRIELRDDGKAIFRDEEGTAYPPFTSIHRDIEISRARAPCPEGDGDRATDVKSNAVSVTPDTATGASNTATADTGDGAAAPPRTGDATTAVPAGLQMPNLVGMPVSRAMETLKALDLTLGQRRTKSGETADLILAHRPGAGEPVERGSAVDLVVAVAEPTPARDVGDLSGQSLHRATEEIGKAGAEIATVTVSTDGPKTPTVTAATPDASGTGVHLEISTTGGDAKLMEIAATVIGQSAEGAALGLQGRVAAAEWLRKNKLGSLGDLSEAAAMEDPVLRRRFRLGAEGETAPVRRLLQSVTARLRTV